MKTLFISRSLRRQRGFSLIEVTISLSIAAMGITSMLGLLPQCLAQLSKASDVTAEARINQLICGSIAQSDWQDASGADALAFTFNGKRYYFDNMALEIPQNETNGSNIAYVAEVRVDSSGFSVPGGDVDPNLKRVRIRLKNTPSPGFDFEGQSPRSYHSFSTLVARTGR